MVVCNKERAFLEADKIMNYDYEYDTFRSSRAGYPIYFTVKECVNEWLCDLGDRLEVNLENGKSVNIWIRNEADEARKELVRLSKEFGYVAF